VDVKQPGKKQKIKSIGNIYICDIDNIFKTRGYKKRLNYQIVRKLLKAPNV
jgi:hypothetical protein